MSSSLVLGVDGGGTSTVAALAIHGRVIHGCGHAGPSNIKAVGPAAAFRALEDAIDAAFRNARYQVQQVDVACLGLAGSDRQVEKAQIREWAEARGLARRLVLVNDADLVLAAGTRDGFGAALISGTGSIAVGKARDGRSARAGGWGHLIGDEGSAYAVALDALRLVARRADGRDHVRGDPPRVDSEHLQETLLAALGITDPSDLASVLYREPIDRARIAGLAPLVVAAASEDPDILPKIVGPAGAALAECVLAVCRAIGWVESALPLALAGTFLLSSRPVRDAVLQSLATRAPFEVLPIDVPAPVTGAVILARAAPEQ
jgi:N-acetylglucosamine kinase-like BadF-type ATPase